MKPLSPSRAHLPVEALAEILAFLPRHSIDRLSATNRQLRDVTSLPRFGRGPFRRVHRLQVSERCIRLVPYKRAEREQRPQLRNDGPGGELGYLVPFLQLPRWLVMVKFDAVDCDLQYFESKVRDGRRVLDEILHQHRHCWSGAHLRLTFKGLHTSQSLNFAARHLLHCRAVTLHGMARVMLTRPLMTYEFIHGARRLDFTHFGPSNDDVTRAVVEWLFSGLGRERSGKTRGLVHETKVLAMETANIDELIRMTVERFLSTVTCPTKTRFICRLKLRVNDALPEAIDEEKEDAEKHQWIKSRITAPMVAQGLSHVFYEIRCNC